MTFLLIMSIIPIKQVDASLQRIDLPFSYVFFLTMRPRTVTWTD